MWKLSFALSATASLLALTAPYAQAQTADGGATPLEEITVEGRGTGLMQGQGVTGVFTSDGYVAKTTRSGTKTDTPLIRIPQSISTVTRQQIEDRKPETLNEALNYTSGARTSAYGFDPRFEAFFVRGFSATYSGVFRDGLRQLNSPSGLFKTEPYGLEGITILKGPASSAFGASSAGGLVDLITKRPTEEPFHEVIVSGGNNDRYQGNFDLSGPVTQDGTLLYRATGLIRKSDTDLTGFPDDRIYFAPAITWKPDDRTKLTVFGEVMDTKTGGTAAFYNFNNKITDNYLGDKRYNDFDQKQQRVGYEFEHRFNEAFTVRQNARFAHVDNTLEYAYATGYDPATGKITGKAAGLNAEEVHTFVVDNQAEYKVDTGRLGHTLLAGVDAGYVRYNQDEGFGALPGEGATPVLGFAAKQNLRQIGVYAQDQIRFDAWTFTAGVRNDWVDGETTTAANGKSNESDHKFTGRIGLSYLTSFGVAPYVVYSTSFSPNVGVTLDRNPAGPTTGEQKEVGLKYQVPGYNAFITTALFDITQKNSSVFNVVNNANELVQLDLRSRGFEVEANASLTNGVDLTAFYSYTDMEILKGQPGTRGNTLNATPFHTAAIWANYTFKSGVARGLGLGGGVRYTGSSFGDDGNTFGNEPRTLIDAKASYDLDAVNPQLKGVRLQLNATNLLDKRTPTCAASYCYYDEGRKVIASLRYRW